MDLEQIKQILDLVREHSLAEFELERDGMKIRIRKEAGASPILTTSPVPRVEVPVHLAAPAAGLAAPTPAASPTALAPHIDTAIEEQESVELAVVKSPIVGTFYRSPDPSAPSFVEVGDTVRKGQVLCIIEAMKLMNEIESEYEGEIANVYVESGQPVQYAERLFAIRRR